MAGKKNQSEEMAGDPIPEILRDLGVSGIVYGARPMMFFEDGRSEPLFYVWAYSLAGARTWH